MGICLSTVPTNETDSENEFESFRKPKYYRGRDGPKFRVLNFTNDYEYRRYETATWISTRIEGINHGKAISRGEKILGRYFNGKNGPERVMAVTCPLTMRVKSWRDFHRGREFVASLHLPYEHHGTPPEPSESRLYVQDMPEHFAYVSSFEGASSPEKWQEEAMKLARVLDSEGVRYNRGACYTARYENALRLGKKWNEVIFVVNNVS